MELSSQNLIDCSTNGQNNGCDGGSPHNALEYITDNGIMNESYYPFTSFVLDDILEKIFPTMLRLFSENDVWEE